MNEIGLSLDELQEKVWQGDRIHPAEARALYDLPLEELGALADRRRQLAKHDAYDGRGNDIVTYIVDRNVNYTNVCNVYCKFCAFYRTETEPDAYVITRAELDQKIEETLALGDGFISAEILPLPDGLTAAQQTITSFRRWFR